MKYSLASLLVFSFCLASAQLSVQNDAYVFVSNQYIYVMDDVNIDDADSKIYLRNEGQLLQGSGTTGNSGIGELSVYQNSEVNQFAYHYWCSPVGGVLTNTTNNNAFRINQLDDPRFDTSDPIDSNDSGFTTGYNGTISPSLTISNRWLYTFITSDEYSEWTYVGEALDIQPGLGFTMKGMSDSVDGTGITPMNQTFDFRGKPNNGTITNPIADGQLTLIGNPYPSAIDAADFLWDPQNGNLDNQDLNPTPPVTSGTTGVIYYWEQSPGSDSHFLEDYVGGYASYTCTQPDGLNNVLESFVPATYSFYLSNGLPPATPPAGTGTREAKRYIPIGQGFMVEGAAGTPSGSLIYLKNSHRNYIKESSGNSFFFRDSNPNWTSSSNQLDENESSQVPDEYKRFRLIVSFNELYSRELLTNFHESATANFDFGLEAKRPSSTSSDAHWTQNGEALVIQAHNFDVDLVIPLVVDIEQQQPLTFRIFDIQNFEESQGIYIHDIENDIYVNLRNQNYDLNIAAGNYTNRFEIVFTSQDALDIETFNSSTLTINQNNGLHRLSVRNPKGLDVASIEVYDVSGKRMLQNIYDSVSDRYELSTSNLSDGVYIVNALSKTNNTIKSQKIIVKN